MPSTPSAHRDELAHAIAELQSREREALMVYRPGTDAQERMHTSGAHTLIVAGGNRAGKTVCSMALFASRVTGINVIGRDEKPIPHQFPLPVKGGKNLYWLIGYDLDHIGQTLYRALFEPGLFDVIWDESLGRYVTFNENIEWHAAHSDDKVPAGPLIPGRLIDETSWVWNPQGGGRAANCFESVELKNGAKIFAFPSSTPQPKQGDPVSGMLIDEDVKFPGHVPEYMARLGDRQGWFIWPAWPHDENVMLGNLIEGSEKAKQEGDTRFEHIQLKMSDNPFFSSAKKRLAIDRFTMLGDEDLIASRIDGERDARGRRVYDFSPMRMGIGSEQALRAPTNLQPHDPRFVLQALYRKNGRLPNTWTRYMALDPSTTRTACIFGCVPPPVVEGVQIPPCLIIEDELILRRAEPKHVAMAVAEKIAGRKYEAFIIDKHIGRQTAVGASRQTWDIFADEFKAAKVSSRQTEHWFIPGCDDIAGRIAVVRKMMLADRDGEPAMYVLLDTTNEWQKEVVRYQKKVLMQNGMPIVVDMPADPRRFDAMAATEYLAAYVYPLLQTNSAYVDPQKYERTGSGLQSVVDKIMGNVPGESGYIHLGPGVAA